MNPSDSPAWPAEGLVDIHCHCVAGIDDGPTSLGEAVELCQALVREGFAEVCATPHQLGRHTGNDRATVLAALDDLRAALADAGVALRVHAGADVRIDERLPELVDAGEALTLADERRHLLLELPHSFLVDPSVVIARLAERGVVTVLTHPERYRYLAGQTAPVDAWRQLGCVVQVTAGSLVGDFGRSAYDHAWRLARMGLVDLVATDAHDARRRPPRMQAAIEMLRFDLGDAEAWRVAVENPRRVLRGEPLRLN